MTKFLTAEWRNLLMANYEVPPQILKPYLPACTEIDQWNGKCFVSLVGFMFMNTTLLGLSVPFHKNFEEVNLRFYVKYKDKGEWKRGVVFVKEIVPKPMITCVANMMYKEKYVTYPMKHSWEYNDQQNLVVNYEWLVDEEWNYLRATAINTPQPLVKGSETEFITEHYWGYTKVDAHSTNEYEVRHPTWNIYEVVTFDKYINTATLYGRDFVPYLSVPPTSVFLAEGSPISVQKAQLITA